jgi:hypothetical protein
VVTVPHLLIFIVDRHIFAIGDVFKLASGCHLWFCCLFLLILDVELEHSMGLFMGLQLVAGVHTEW